jgi:hypothetical protein
VRLEGLGKVKKKSDNLNGNRTCDLPACSIVPQKTILSRAPKHYRIFCEKVAYSFCILRMTNGVSTKQE